LRWLSEISDDGIILQRPEKRIHDGRGDSCSWNLHDCGHLLFKALATLWRTTAYVKEKQVITQIMDSALNEALYLQRLEEGSTEIYIEERDLDLETIVVPLEEMETIDGNFLQNMWQVTVIARFEQDGQYQERVVRGWRYLPLYR
jgi:hypothetical protein